MTTGVTTTLHAIAARSVDDAVVVGDDGVVLVWRDGWKRVEAPLLTYRAALRVGPVTYIAGDNGTLLRLPGGVGTTPSVARVPLDTTCTLRALFSRGDEVWVVGSDSGRAAVWRIVRGTVFRWGQCP